jgi:hypothetical protein
MNSALIKYLLFFSVWAGMLFAGPVYGQNNPPVCVSIGSQTVALGSSLTITFQASDPDGDALTLTASGTPLSNGAVFGQTVNGSNATAVFSWTPPVTSSGNFTLVLTATDNNSGNPLSCSQSVSISVTGAPPTLETICLLNQFAPGGFAMFLGGLPSVYSDQYVFQGTGGLFEALSDGTANIIGNIVNIDSATWRWIVDIKLVNRRSWADWSALGRSYKGTTPEALANHPNWDYYEVDPSSRLMGLNRFSGDTLYISHAPSNMYYGFQFGTGANDKNGEVGMSGWFSYTGAYSGAGDVNVINFCRGRIPTFAGLAVLEGAYDANSTYMRTGLNQASLFPLNQPYGNTDYAYTGTESISASDAVDMVDWLLVQFRDATNPATVVYQKAVLLHKNGHLVDTDGNYLIEIDPSLTGSYYIAICHRNHLDVMTAQPVTPGSNEMFDYDFTEGLAKLYHDINGNSEAAKQVSATGPWVMMSGDVTNTDAISAADLRKAGLELNQAGFNVGDVNLSGTITQQDLDMILSNFFKQSQVPK